MSKKFVLAFIILFGLMFLLSPAECFAGPAELLQQAGTYRDTGYTQQAQQLYSSVANDFPGTEYALKARAELIILSIPPKAQAQLQADIDGLKADFSGHTGLPGVLCDIGAGYGWSSRFEQAKSLYQQVIEEYPESGDVSKAQLGISRTNVVQLIKSGDYTTAAAEINKILGDFSGHPYLPAALYQIAKRYQWSRQYEEAKSTYQQIIQCCPDSPQASAAQLDVAKMDILSFIKARDFNAAEARIDKLLEDFSGHLGLAEVLRKIAREYEVQGSGTQRPVTSINR